jgi:hypothetical protein
LPHASKKAVAGTLIAAISAAAIAASAYPALAGSAQDVEWVRGWGNGHVSSARGWGLRHGLWYRAGYYSGRWAFPFMPYPYYGYRFSCYGNGWPDYEPHACGYFYPE